MFEQNVEGMFANNPRGSGKAASGRTSARLLLLVAAAVLGFFVWASKSEIEEFTKGQGQVIPSRKVQVVQSLEGGIVRAIYVREGDTVAEGDVIMLIDDTRFASELGELKQRRGALLAERLRLVGESMRHDDISFPAELREANPLATRAEGELFRTRRAQLNRELQILDDRLRQRKSELAELEAEQVKRRKMIVPLGEEVELTEQMTRTGAVPKIEFLRLMSKMAALEGDLAVGEASKLRLEAVIAQAETEIEVAQSGYELTARQRLAELQVELAVVEEGLRAARDRVARTSIRAPVHGTVNAVPITTLGAVVGPGQALAEIVPVDDGLVIEANLRPADVAFVRPGARVSVKITAYDYLIYGDIPGYVERIGADTIAADDGTEFFRVVVQTEQSHLGDAERPLPISPGMVASIDILTGRKTVLDYLLKPLRRAQYEAMRER
ncbi:HlyD family type I secretion periplasmic adaptor subunit [Ruegeria pomeroyi]|nr:HlyD family type I secretion periplasmic adaptor subunit [Ruegeria pomeroyi]MCE8546803.1 HlyD family type I secretion periplasmic adaptor subunit [Ruegeria pomeroyi]